MCYFCAILLWTTGANEVRFDLWKDDLLELHEQEIDFGKEPDFPADVMVQTDIGSWVHPSILIDISFVSDKSLEDDSTPPIMIGGRDERIPKIATPVLSAEDTRLLLDSIDTTTVVGLRDRAIIATMVFSFARVGAVSQLKVKDYYQNGKRWWFRFLEKGGKFHEVPAHHLAEQYVDEYLQEAGIQDDTDGPLFRPSNGKTKKLFRKRLSPNQVLKMVKRRCEEVGLPETICSHSFRATGITAYLSNGGTLERAQKIACHESPRTTKLYDRTDDSITLDEIERILI